MQLLDLLSVHVADNTFVVVGISQGIATLCHAALSVRHTLVITYPLEVEGGVVIEPEEHTVMSCRHMLSTLLTPL